MRSDIVVLQAVAAVVFALAFVVLVVQVSVRRAVRVHGGAATPPGPAAGRALAVTSVVAATAALLLVLTV